MGPILRAGLVAPAVIAVLALLTFWIAGPGWAVTVLAAGCGAVLAFDVWNMRRLQRWAKGPLDGAVPEGFGPWRPVFTAMYRRTRTRTAFARDLTQTIGRFQRAAEAVPDGMAVLDAQNRIRWANRRAQAHLGIDISRDIGRPIANLVRHPEFARYLATAGDREPAIMPAPREPGVRLSLQMIPFGADEKLLIARDITQLEAVARMRRDFIADVSHELKTPLTVVVGFIETLQDLALSPDQHARYLDMIQQQARSMQRLVDDLLTLSALESEQRDVLDAWFPVAMLIEEVADGARALSAGGHRVAVAVEQPALVRGSRDELASAFGNLVSNAIRYTPAGGEVALRWKIEPDGSGVFAVTDTGIGIAPEHLPRLTERFYRVDRSRSRATGGTGLGLAIVKHVLLRHDAELTVTSEPGKGSTFAAHLPADRVQAMPADVQQVLRGEADKSHPSADRSAPRGAIPSNNDAAR